MSAKCGSKKHDEVCGEHPEEHMNLCKITSRKYPKYKISDLQARGILGKRATYLCSLCVKYLCHADEPTPKKPKANPKPIDLVLEDIERGILNQTEMQKLANALGKSQHEHILRDAHTQCGSYQDILEKKGHVPTRNPVLSQFLLGLCCLQAETELDGKCTSFQLAMEQLYFLVHERFVGQQSFMKTVLLYFASRSKKAVTVMCQDGPFGSYPTLCYWQKVQGK